MLLFHLEYDDLTQPYPGGVEASPEIGFGRPRPLAGSDSPRTIGEKLELSGVVHTRSLIIPRIHTSKRPSA